MQNNNNKQTKAKTKAHIKMSNSFNEIMGELIRAKRKALNLSPVNIAKSLNISYQTYSKYETGKITIPIENLFIIAKLFNTSIDSWLDYYFEYQESRNNNYDFFDEKRKGIFKSLEEDKRNIQKLNKEYPNLEQYANSFIEKKPDSLIEKNINIVKKIYESGDEKLIRFLDDFLDYLNFIIESQRK